MLGLTCSRGLDLNPAVLPEYVASHDSSHRIGEEDRIVAWRVVVLGRGVEHMHLLADEEAVESIDVGTALTVKCQMMQAWRVAIVRRGDSCRVQANT
jgi:hypothetical protein